MSAGLGIDLGTTFSLVAHARAGRCRVLPLVSGDALLPSVVRVGTRGVVVGAVAAQAQRGDPENAIAFFKTDMGTPQVAYELGGRIWTPAELSAEVLKKLRADVRVASGVELGAAVITVPAYFTDRARRATLGDRPRPLDNDPLGRFSFGGVPHGAGETLVDITFGYDEDGLVRIAAGVNGSPLPGPVEDRDVVDLSWSDGVPAATASATVAVVLVIDSSGSMAGKRLRAAKSACREFLDTLADGGHRCGLVAFAGGSRVLAPLGAPLDTVRRAADRLSAGGGTALHAGLDSAHRELAGEAAGERDRIASGPSPAASLRAVVVLSDGQTDVRAAIEAAGRLRADRIEIAAVGLPGANAALLEQLATIRLESLMTPTEGLAASFRAIARELQTRAGLASAG